VILPYFILLLRNRAKIRLIERIDQLIYTIADLMKKMTILLVQSLICLLSRKDHSVALNVLLKMMNKKMNIFFFKERDKSERRLSLNKLIKVTFSRKRERLEKLDTVKILKMHKGTNGCT
jgi:hypothetical protein